MTNSGAHYEQAFESLLVRLGVNWHRIDQSRKAAGDDGPLKSFDYLIHPERGAPLLIDVKGRRLPARLYGQGKLGQSWVTEDDFRGMDRWEKSFAAPVTALFVFAYWIYDLPAPDAAPAYDRQPTALLYYCHGRFYSFMAVALADYRRRMKRRSARWHTVFVPTAGFEAIARPFDRVCHP